MIRALLRQAKELARHEFGKMAEGIGLRHALGALYERVGCRAAYHDRQMRVMI